MKFIIYILAAFVIWITELLLGKQLANVHFFEMEYISFRFMKPDRDKDLECVIKCYVSQFFCSNNLLCNGTLLRKLQCKAYLDYCTVLLHD